MQKPFIYLRSLKRADHTVFAVTDGQKTYYDPVFGKVLPYSSGQQVKRCILEALLRTLNEPAAPITFVSVYKDKKIGEGEVTSLCNPRYADQLLGGWMKAEGKKEESKGAKGKNKAADGSLWQGDETVEGVVAEKTRTLKRRSPLSLSAMYPLHPTLAGTNKENVSFDRSERPHEHKVIVRDAAGRALSDDQIYEALRGTNRSLLRKWIQDQTRASGLFVQDTVIDLRRLFTVSTDLREPELDIKDVEKLRAEGWKETRTAFGPALVCPAPRRAQLIRALAHALVYWEITSNQSRNHHPRETLAIAISTHAQRNQAAIYAKLTEDHKQADIVISPDLPDTKLFITVPGAGYIQTTNEDPLALDHAVDTLIEMMESYDYEQQLLPVKP